MPLDSLSCRQCDVGSTHNHHIQSNIKNKDVPYLKKSFLGVQVFKDSWSLHFVVSHPRVPDTKMISSVVGWPLVYVLKMIRMLTVLHHGQGLYLIEEKLGKCLWDLPLFLTTLFFKLVVASYMCSSSSQLKTKVVVMMMNLICMSRVFI